MAPLRTKCFAHWKWERLLARLVCLQWARETNERRISTHLASRRCLSWPRVICSVPWCTIRRPRICCSSGPGPFWTRTIKNNRERIQTLLERVVDIGRGDSSRVIDDLLIWTSGYTRGLRFRQSQWLTARTLITLAPDCSSASFHRADIRSSPDNNPSLLSFKFFPALVCASFTFSVKLIFTLYKGL